MTLSITGKVWVFGNDLNTDAMYPAFAMKMDPPEAAKHIFYEVRPGWTDQVSAGDIVLAGKNFGVGSSRPVAALFSELGVAGLVAELASHLDRPRGIAGAGRITRGGFQWRRRLSHLRRRDDLRRRLQYAAGAETVAGRLREDGRGHR